MKKYTWIFLIPTWINGATNNSPQRIPSPVIKPVMKLVKSFFCQETSCTVVEISGNKTVKYFSRCHLCINDGHKQRVPLTDQIHGWRFQTSKQKKVWSRRLKRIMFHYEFGFCFFFDKNKTKLDISGFKPYRGQPPWTVWAVLEVCPVFHRTNAESPLWSSSRRYGQLSTRSNLARGQQWDRCLEDNDHAFVIKKKRNE